MRRVIFATVIAATTATAGAAEEYVLDPAHTYPNFTINHLGFSTVFGRFNSSEGTLVLDREQGTGSVEVVVDTASIDTGHEKRDEHLRSPDFFNVVEFPEMTFRSTNVTLNGDDTASVEGELTLIGVTKPVSLEVTRISCGSHPFNQAEMCGFDAQGTIKRSDFGMGYGLPALGDEITLYIGAEGVKQEG